VISVSIYRSSFQGVSPGSFLTFYPGIAMQNWRKRIGNVGIKVNPFVYYSGTLHVMIVSIAPSGMIANLKSIL
jgi:hypothetical protein